MYRYVHILPVFDMFGVKIGGVQQIIDSQEGCRPDEDMIVSSAPSFGGPGGHIFDVVAQVVKKHVFTVIYSHASTACSIGTTAPFVDLNVSN
jgi:hypothetical protein